MVSRQTVEVARSAATTLRERGDLEGARAVEELIQAARNDAVPRLDLLTSTEAGELVGVTGQTIKNWVRQGTLQAYRIGGRIMVPASALAHYVERARQSLDLDPIPDDEAAQLVAEGRTMAK